MSSEYHVQNRDVGNVVIGSHSRVNVNGISVQPGRESDASEIDLSQLARELEMLRQELRRHATTRKHDATVAEIGAAADEAERGDGPAVLHRLRAAGQWALDTATSIGTTVAAAAIRKSMGM